MHLWGGRPSYAPQRPKHETFCDDDTFAIINHLDWLKTPICRWRVTVSNTIEWPSVWHIEHSWCGRSEWVYLHVLGAFLLGSIRFSCSAIFCLATWRLCCLCKDTHHGHIPQLTGKKYQFDGYGGIACTILRSALSLSAAISTSNAPWWLHFASSEQAKDIGVLPFWSCCTVAICKNRRGFVSRAFFVFISVLMPLGAQLFHHITSGLVGIVDLSFR